MGGEREGGTKPREKDREREDELTTIMIGETQRRCSADDAQ